MVSDAVYGLLRELLDEGEIEFPALSNEPFQDGFIPQFRACHITAERVQSVKGYQPVAGIAFLDLNGKLYPWPHFVNMHPDVGLIDYSPAPDQPVLGFIRVAHHQIPMLQAVVDEYNALAADASSPDWSDPLAAKLHGEFMPKLVAAHSSQALTPQ